MHRPCVLGFALVAQDIKKGELRDYTWGDMMFNYGALPQTWEDPSVIDPSTGCGGDDDPLDAVRGPISSVFFVRMCRENVINPTFEPRGLQIDIGTRQWPMGTILRLKPLGALALLDEGETDWCVRPML